MLVDNVTIVVKGGNGGNGAVSFIRNAQTAKGGPDGGNGGNGGSVYAIGVSDITALAQFQFQKKAKSEDGIPGKKKNLYGRNGKDLVIKLPIGTLVTDTKTNTSFEITNTQDKILLAKGGKGGRGNNEFKSATRQTPTFAEKGEEGEEKSLKLQLKLIADIGIIGLPNSGKSSLLKFITNAKPKVGNYPFTTLEPNLGMLDGITLADIPGLIEGASSGKGLGIHFLQHIEKTKLLIHCIESTEENVLKAYEIVKNEFETYNKNILSKKQVIFLTKVDLISQKDLDKKTKQLKKLHLDIIPISIYQNTPDEIKETVKKLHS